VQRGFKGKNKLDTQAHYSMHELREKHGLLTDSIWHEALDGIALNTRAYYISVMRRGSKLDVNPRIRISTIHGAKGGEADNVVLLLAMSKRTYQGYEMQQDDEQRVFYVGMTRAKHRLTMVDSHNSMEFML
jgi:superfamily I DNA/RNA helicase